MAATDFRHGCEVLDRLAAQEAVDSRGPVLRRIEELDLEIDSLLLNRYPQELAGAKIDGKGVRFAAMKLLFDLEAGLQEGSSRLGDVSGGATEEGGKQGEE
ncbi:MAG TPA: hypothetical protein VKK31_24595 [Thermoanaerobaculia bacterium]|nr:hypothetical protein [Thermoanaerobaculia bacterium]